LKQDRQTRKEGDNPVQQEHPSIIEVGPDIYQFRSEKPGSHIYLIRGRSKNVLIDTGTTSHFPLLKSRLSDVGLRVRDVHLVLLTHEHFDHIGATAFFHRTAVVAAHRLAANKVELQDDFVTLNRYYNVPSKPFWVDIWLEDGAVIELGNRRLRVVHTPGHTSGCVCYFEPDEGLLFSGDTVFAGGTLSDVAGSGSVSDYMESVQRLNNLKIKKILPGHGRSSDAPEEDMPKALENARELLSDSKVFFEAFIKTRELKGQSGYWQEKP
jgi:glyoxylase-like metal-dependent hydrolase (beta-lactamase superfamily II)